MGRGGVAIDIILLFVRDKSDLAMRLPSTLSRLREGGVLWLAWPKQSSGVDTDLTRDRIRKLGCAAGVEAGRVITIDKTWAGMRFTK